MKLTSIEILEEQQNTNTTKLVDNTKKKSIEQLNDKINSNQDLDTEDEMEKQDKMANQLFKKTIKTRLIKRDKHSWDSATDHYIKSELDK